jgi:flagellar motor switch protein FliN/FliY
MERLMSDTANPPSVPAENARTPAVPAAAEDHLNLDLVMRVPVTLEVVLGRTSMPVANLLKLGRGAVVSLDHKVGEPVDVVVNGRIIARGEVVLVDEERSRFGVTLTEIVSPAAADPRG